MVTLWLPVRFPKDYQGLPARFPKDYQGLPARITPWFNGPFLYIYGKPLFYWLFHCFTDYFTVLPLVLRVFYQGITVYFYIFRQEPP